jgi:hypothetical protein
MRKRLVFSLLFVVFCLLVAPACAVAQVVSIPVMNGSVYTYHVGSSGAVVDVYNYAESDALIGEMWYEVDRKTDDGWVEYLTIEGRYGESGRAEGEFTILRQGTYRVRAELRYWGSTGGMHTASSSWRSFKVRDAEIGGTTYLSKPLVSRMNRAVSEEFTIASRMHPGFHNVTRRQLFYYIYRRNGSDDWVYQSRIKVDRMNFESSTLTTGKTTVRLGQAGRYRIRAEFIWRGVDQKSHVQKSGYRYLLITK